MKDNISKETEPRKTPGVKKTPTCIQIPQLLLLALQAAAVERLHQPYRQGQHGEPEGLSGVRYHLAGLQERFLSPLCISIAAAAA